MAENYKLELVGVLGYPVAENPSCVMHEAAFAALGLPWRYLTLEVAPAALPDAIRGVRALGMQGVNLTIPHKVAVLPLLDAVSPDAARIGAVNTVRREGNRLIGENTDGKGFLRGLRQEAGLDPAGRNVLLLGAGGAARAIAFELAAAGVGRLAIANRSAERGAALCADLRQRAGLAARFELWTGLARSARKWIFWSTALPSACFPMSPKCRRRTWKRRGPICLFATRCPIRRKPVSSKPRAPGDCER